VRHLLQPHVGARPTTASAHAHWKLDEASATDSAVDALGSWTASDAGSPGVAGSLFAVPSGSTGSREFDGSSTYFFRSVNDSALAASVASECAVSAVVEPNVVTGTQTIFEFSGFSGVVSANNVQISLRLVGDEVSVHWEYGAGVDVTSTTTGALLSAGKKYLIVASVHGSSTSKTLDVFIFGEGGLAHSETFTGLTEATGGSSADFTIGRSRDTSSNHYDGHIDDVVLWKRRLTERAAHLLYAETFGMDHDEATLYTRGDRMGHVHVRAVVLDDDDEIQDLTNLGRGFDFFESATITENEDDPGMTANLRLFREVDGWSLSTLNEASPLNQDSGGFASLIALNRWIAIETAVMPDGIDPDDHDWVPAFEGYVTAIDWGRDIISVTLNDESAALDATWIGKQPLEITAIDDSGTGNTIEITTSTAHGLSDGDQFSIYSTTNYNGRFTVKDVPSSTTIETVETTAGAFASESSGDLFPPDVSVYGSSGSGTDLEYVAQAIIDDNAPAVGYIGGTPSIYTPTSPNFGIKSYHQQRESVLSAVNKLTDTIGWLTRYRWDPETRDFLLTIYEPDRTKSSADYVFAADDILEVNSARLDAANIRTAVEVTFSDSDGGQDGAGQYPRVTVRREASSALIAQYGYRLAQISEASASQIDTYAEAVALADAFLDDLAQPTVELGITVPLRRFVDTGDLYTVPALTGTNGEAYHFDNDQDLAVRSYTHELAPGPDGCRTTLVLRGQPSTGVGRWGRITAGIGALPPVSTAPSFQATAPVALAGVESVEVSAAWDLSDRTHRNVDLVEVHTSTTSGFAPDASTFHSMARGDRILVSGLDPADGTQHVRLRPRDRAGNVGQWTAQASTTPLYFPASLPRFRAKRTSVGVTVAGSATALTWSSEDYDVGGNWASNEFTAPVDGYYRFTLFLYVRNANAVIPLLYKDTGSGYALEEQGAQIADDRTTFVSEIYCDAGDKIKPYAASSPGTDRHYTGSWFSGVLIPS
jgi:hypothetical protein